MERERGLPKELDLGEALFDAELFPPTAFFLECFFMGRKSERPFHSTTMVAHHVGQSNGGAWRAQKKHRSNAAALARP
ncbi:MAG: hypothetical protein FWD69_05940 [Polyangiaceae bacterium]|nr:hypothetical protein [Polyangiaceae bacterium]